MYWVVMVTLLSRLALCVISGIFACLQIVHLFVLFLLVMDNAVTNDAVCGDMKQLDLPHYFTSYYLIYQFGESRIDYFVDFCFVTSVSVQPQLRCHFGWQRETQNYHNRQQKAG